MKKFFQGLILMLSLIVPSISYAGHGGDSFAGGLAGGMIGGVVAGAMTKDGSGKRAERKVEMIEREQQYDRYARQQSHINMLIIFLVMIFLAAVIMGIMLFRKKR